MLNLIVSQREPKYVTTYDCSRLTELGEAPVSSFFSPDDFIADYEKPRSMSELPVAARMLATVFLRGTWSPEELLARGRLVLAKRRDDLRLPAIVSAVVNYFGAEPPVPRWQELAEFLAAGRGRHKLIHKLTVKRQIGEIDLPPSQMQPARALENLASVPAIV